MSSDNYHEPLELLSQDTVEMHRAIVSLIEELEAVDWYQQRADACTDPELKKILIHHKNEEIEHAIMNLEWIRRSDAHFDENCRRFLFSDKSITELEETEMGSQPPNAGTMANTMANSDKTNKVGDASLGIRSLKSSSLSEVEYGG